MTHPTPSDRATGCATDGKSHLNLTRTMADVWRRDASKRRKWPRDVLADQKVPYAGKDQ